METFCFEEKNDDNSTLSQLSAFCRPEETGRMGVCVCVCVCVLGWGVFVCMCVLLCVRVWVIVVWNTGNTVMRRKQKVDTTMSSGPTFWRDVAELWQNPGLCTSGNAYPFVMNSVLHAMRLAVDKGQDHSCYHFSWPLVTLCCLLWHQCKCVPMSASSNSCFSAFWCYTSILPCLIQNSKPHSKPPPHIPVLNVKVKGNGHII